MLWKDKEEKLIEFIQYLNAIHQKIQFTLETQNNQKTLNFLDLSITLKNNTHTYEIFRKNTHTGITINNQSNHPYTHKFATFYSYIDRLLKIPLSTEAYDKELDTIKEIAIRNNFSIELIHKILNKKKNKIQENEVYIQNPQIIINNQNKKYTSLTFIGPVSYKIANIFREYVNIAYSTIKTRLTT